MTGRTILMALALSATVVLGTQSSVARADDYSATPQLDTYVAGDTIAASYADEQVAEENGDSDVDAEDLMPGHGGGGQNGRASCRERG